MKDPKASFWLGIGFLLVFLLAVAHSALDPPHRDIRSEKPDYELSAQALVRALRDPHTARDYGDKVLLVGGRVVDFQDGRLLLDPGVSAILSETPGDTPQVGDSILLKARCLGYDPLFEEVKLDRASIIKYY